MYQSLVVKAKTDRLVECSVNLADENRTVVIQRHDSDAGSAVVLSAEEARCIVSFLTGNISKNII